MEINISGHFENSENHSSPGNDFTNQSENYDQRNYYTITVCVAVNVLLSFTALFGNCAILITLWKTPSLHSPVNILLASLAVSDLTVGLVVQPLFMAATLKQDSTIQAIYLALSAFLCSVSFYTTTAIGVDRFLALQLHLRYDAVVTPFRLIGMVIFLWVFSGLYSSGMLWIPNLFYTALALITLALLAVNFGVYLKIYFIVRRHQFQIAHQQQQQQQQHQGHQGNTFWRLKKSAVNTFLVYIVLLVCYTPLCLVIAFKFQGAHSTSASDAQIITTTILYLNSSLNPLLYCWRIREIRTAMKNHFCC